MNLSAFCCCAALVALSTLSTATAATGGACTYRDARLSFVDGYSYRALSDFGDAEAETRITLTTIELDVDTNAVTSAAAPSESLFDREVGQLELTLGADGVTSVYANFPRGPIISRSGTAFGDLRLSRNDAAGVTGRFTLAPDGTDDLGCDVNFDLSYIAASKAVLANVTAQRKTDVSTPLAHVSHVSKEQADPGRAHRKEADSFFKCVLAPEPHSKPANSGMIPRCSVLRM